MGHFALDNAHHRAHVAADGFKDRFPVFRRAFVRRLGAAGEKGCRQDGRAKGPSLKKCHGASPENAGG